jgi:hypothetical protein
MILIRGSVAVGDRHNRCSCTAAAEGQHLFIRMSDQNESSVCFHIGIPEKKIGSWLLKGR